MLFKINAHLTDRDSRPTQLVGEADYDTANSALGDALRMANDSGYTIQSLTLRRVQPQPAGFHFRTPRHGVEPVEVKPLPEVEALARRIKTKGINHEAVRAPNW